MDNQQIIDCLNSKINHLNVTKLLLENTGITALSGYDDAIALCQEEINQLS
jgi:hypothetical protein